MCFGRALFLSDLGRTFDLVAFSGQLGDEAVRVFGGEFHRLGGEGDRGGEDAGLAVHELFELDGAGCTVKGGDLIDLCLEIALVRGWYDADIFIDGAADGEQLRDEAVRIFFGNDAELFLREGDRGEEDGWHFADLPFHFRGAFHAVEVLHVIEAALVFLS